MPRFIVESGAEKGMVYNLSSSPVVIGRSPGSDIRLNDKRISRRHALVRPSREGYTIQDLGSKNGVFVNGVAIAGETSLANGDRVIVGDSYFLFESDKREVEERPVSEAAPSGAVKLVESNQPLHQEEVRMDVAVAPALPRPMRREVLRDPFERLKVLYDVSDAIRLVFEIDELLAKIMDILWSVLTPDRGVILLRDEAAGALQPVVIRSRSNPGAEITVSGTIVERAIAERVAILVSDASTDARFAGSESILAGQIRSALCVPLLCMEEVLGVIYIDCLQGADVRYTHEELELMTGIANQAAMAITNARLYRQAIDRQKLEKELEIARSIQTNLLPRGYPEIEGLGISAMSLPARKVGGDYYDFVLREDGRMALVVADVSGKGMAAALLTATIRASVRMEAQRPGDPAVDDIVASINRWTCRDATNSMFVTMVFCMYDPASRRFSYTNAGHCFPLLFKPDGQYRALEAGGCFLGIMERVDYMTESFEIGHDETLVFYTDGVTDTQNTDNQVFGVHRLVETVRANLAESPEGIRDAIYEATLDFRADRDQFDDLTLVIAKFA